MTGQPLLTLALVVAGPEVRLEHHGTVDQTTARLRLGVRPGRTRELTEDPAHLTAALVRLTRMRPRRTPRREEVPFPAARLPELVGPEAATRRAALAEAGAGFAWHLSARWGAHGDGVELTATDGPTGLFLADPGHDLLRPVSNTQAYRVLSTLLPLAAARHGLG